MLNGFVIQLCQSKTRHWVKIKSVATCQKRAMICPPTSPYLGKKLDQQNIPHAWAHRNLTTHKRIQFHCLVRGCAVLILGRVLADPEMNIVQKFLSRNHHHIASCKPQDGLHQFLVFCRCSKLCTSLRYRIFHIPP